MSDHLRFTPEDFAVIRRACAALSLVGSYNAFQRVLTAALRPVHPGLGERIRRLRQRQVRTLRCHLEGMGRSPAGEESCARLSFQEWQSVSHAAALICLWDDCPHAFHGRLVGEVRETEPALADKLGRLDDRQVATLYHKVKTGKR